MLRNIEKFRHGLWIAIPLFLFAGMVFLMAPGTDDLNTTDDEIDELNTLLDEFEDAYSNERQNDLRNLFFADAVIAYDFDGGDTQRIHCLEDWLQGTQEHTFDTNESISDELDNREIVVFRNIAYAVCDYTYRDDTKTGVGVDIFTFMKMRDRWRIISLQFTGDEVVR